MSPTDPNELGALWVKSSSRGDYMTGTINGEPVVIFRNDKKAPGSKQPDWRVLRPKEREQAAPIASAYVPQGAPLTDDDIPF